MGIERGGGGIERWRRWREDEGEMEIDGSEEEVRLGLGLDRWVDLLGGPIGQLGFSLSFSLAEKNYRQG